MVRKIVHGFAPRSSAAARPSAAVWPLASSRQKKHISQLARHSGAYLAGTLRTSSASLAAGRWY